MTASTRLCEVLAPLLAAQGYDLEQLVVSGAGKRSVVRVLVDKDGGIDLDEVAGVSRLISDALDAADEQDPDLLGPSYVLEVSSPGVDRPLTQPRHWRRNVSRLVTVHPREGQNFDGRVLSATDDAVTLDVAGTERVVPLSDVAKGVVQVEFNRKDQAPAADEEDEA